MIFKKYIIVCFIILIGELFLSCQTNNKKDQQNETNLSEIDNSRLIQKATIKVISDDSLVLKRIHLLNLHLLPNSSSERYIKTYLKDTTVIDIILEKPQIVNFNTFGIKTIYITRFLLSPGDNILLNIKDKNLTATGENAAHYNFYPKLDSSNTTYRYIPYKNDLKDYKKRIKANYLKRKQFFDSYIKKNVVTEDFIAIMGAQIRYEYLYNLMGPRSKEIKGEGEKDVFYVNNFDNFLFDEVKEINIEKDGIFDFGKYFDQVSLEDFKKPELLKNNFFRVNLIFFIRQYFLDSGYANYSKSKFLEEKKFIQDNFGEEIETYAIARLLLDYHKNSFGLGKENYDLLKQTIEEYYDQFLSDDSYVEKIDELKQSLENFKRELSDELLQTKLIDLKGDTISLNEVFNKSKNKIKVIDFWASWCLPCLDEVQKSQSIRSALAKNSNLELIYFSIDKDKSAWIKTSKKLAKYGMLKNQYLISNFKSSELNHYLKVKSIPRYVIFNKQNEIVVEDAPRPTDSIRFKQVLNEILMKR